MTVRFYPLVHRRCGLAVPLLVLLAGCFPIELDVDRQGRLAIARQEGWCLFDPATRTTTVVRVAEGERPVFARFSPDGAHLLTVGEVRGVRGHYDLTLSPLAGGPGRRLARVRHPTYLLYAPDGRRVALTRVAQRTQPPFDSQPLPELVVLDVDSGEPRVLASNVGALFRWEHAGGRIIAVELTARDDHERFLGRLIRIDVHSGEATPLVSVLLGQSYDLDLSADGRRALLCALDVGPLQHLFPGESESLQQLFRIDLAGGGLTRTERPAAFARYSPGGQAVLLGGFPVSGPELWTADAELTAYHRVADDLYQGGGIGAGGEAFPGWLDDDRLYYLAARAVYGVDGTSPSLTIVRRDGTERVCVQPLIDAAAIGISLDQ